MDFIVFLMARDFCKKYVTTYDYLLWSFYLFLFVFGLVLIIINSFLTQYPGFIQLQGNWLFIGPLSIIVVGFSCYVYKESPRVSLFVQTICYILLFCIIGMLFIYAVEFSPFDRVDATIIQWDHFFGIHVEDALIITEKYHLRDFFSFAYNSIVYQMPFTPIIAALLGTRRTMQRFFLAIIMLFFMIAMIYYFFPTTAPASMLDSRLYTSAEHHTYLKFFNIHHYVVGIMSVIDDGGLVSFPSWHVASAFMMTYVVCDVMYLFVPILLFNVVTILSTIFLGYHYFSDVISALLLGVFSLYISYKLVAWSDRSADKHPFVI